MFLLYSYVVTTIVLQCVMKCCYYIDMLLLQDGWTALHYACDEGHMQVSELLLNNHADISATTNVSGKIL